MVLHDFKLATAAVEDCKLPFVTNYVHSLFLLLLLPAIPPLDVANMPHGVYVCGTGLHRRLCRLSPKGREQTGAGPRPKAG